MTASDMDGFPLFSEPPPHADPRPIHDRLLKLPEHDHLQGASFEYLLRNVEKIKAGRHVLGSIHQPAVQGELRDLFTWMLESRFGYLPDFLILLDAEYWLGVDDAIREILIYHELQHVQPALDKYGAPRLDKISGEPKLRIAGHDVEEFTAVVRRYGAWSPELAAFQAALNSE